MLYLAANQDVKGALLVGLFLLSDGSQGGEFKPVALMLVIEDIVAELRSSLKWVNHFRSGVDAFCNLNDIDILMGIRLCYGGQDSERFEWCLKSLEYWMLGERGCPNAFVSMPLHQPPFATRPAHGMPRARLGWRANRHAQSPPNFSALQASRDWLRSS